MSVLLLHLLLLLLLSDLYFLPLSLSLSLLSLVHEVSVGVLGSLLKVLVGRGLLARHSAKGAVLANNLLRSSVSRATGPGVAGVVGCSSVVGAGYQVGVVTVS